MSIRKQAGDWALAFLLVALLSGLFYLVASVIKWILGIAIPNNTPEENGTIAGVIVIVGVVLLILLNL